MRSTRDSQILKSWIESAKVSPKPAALRSWSQPKHRKGGFEVCERHPHRNMAFVWQPEKLFIPRKVSLPPPFFLLALKPIDLIFLCSLKHFLIVSTSCGNSHANSISSTYVIRKIRPLDCLNIRPNKHGSRASEVGPDGLRTLCECCGHSKLTLFSCRWGCSWDVWAIQTHILLISWWWNGSSVLLCFWHALACTWRHAIRLAIPSPSQRRCFWPTRFIPYVGRPVK